MSEDFHSNKHESNVRIGSRIRASREALNISRRTLMKDTGLSMSSITAIENGQRKVTQDELAMLANYFGLTVEVMLNATAAELEKQRAELVKIFDTCSRQGREAIMRTARFWEKTFDVSALAAQPNKEEDA